MKDENGKLIKVHPYAARFPLMSDEELAELAEDIKENGLKNPLIRDSDGTLIDGRNRLAACKIAKIEPTFVEFNGDQNPVAFIISLNLQRRNLNRGQQAMLVGLGVCESHTSKNRAAKETRLDRSQISRACFIIKNAPDQVDLVLAGLPFEQAFKVAEKRIRDAESEQAKTDRLHKEASDLAEQVAEGKLTLAEGIGALEAREKEAAKLAEIKEQERQLATEQLQKVLMFCAPGEGRETKEKALYWFSLIDPKYIQNDITTEQINQSAEVLKIVAKQWGKTYAKNENAENQNA